MPYLSFFSYKDLESCFVKNIRHETKEACKAILLYPEG